MMNDEVDMSDETLIENYLNNFGVTKCPTRSARGVTRHATVLVRGKKNMRYNTNSAPKMRLMNYDSAYNIPIAYNGCKMVMGSY